MVQERVVAEEEIPVLGKRLLEGNLARKHSQEVHQRLAQVERQMDQRHNAQTHWKEEQQEHQNYQNHSYEQLVQWLEQVALLQEQARQRNR